MTILEEIEKAIIDGKDEAMEGLVKKAINEGFKAEQVLDSFSTAMNISCDKYERKEYYLSDVVCSSDAMNIGLDFLKPHLKSTEEGNKKGVIVLGVVKGCPHNVGKNILYATFMGAGFDVCDLGVSVPPQKFVDKVREMKADILAMSSPLQQTCKYFTETVKLLEESGLRQKVKVIVGGASTNGTTAEQYGADGWAKNANEALLLAERLVSELRGA
jgi:dimethylamine corrinoid protein